MKLIGVFSGLVLTVLAGPAWAIVCTANPDTVVTLPSGNFNIPVDRWEPGIQLSPASVVQDFSPMSCANTGIHSDYDIWSQALLVDSGVRWGSLGQTFTVFESGVPGVGYAIAVRFNVTTGGDWVPLTSASKKLRTGASGAWDGKMQMAVWFVATGKAPIGPHSTPEKQFLKVWSNIALGGQSATGYVNGAANEFVVETSGCTLLDGQVDVDMGVVSAAKYLNATGDSTAAKQVSIPIECDGEVAVDMQVGDVGSPDAGHGILPLKTGAASAAGVGIQMLRADGVTPIPLGVDVRVFDKTAIGRNDISLAARYYQTAEKVIPGKAGALAEFTLKYR